MGLVVFRGLVRIEEGPPRGFIVYTPLPRASPPRGLGAVEGLDREEALLTGENDPVPTHAGDAVLSGSAVVAGAGLVRATAVGSASHAARLSAEARRYSAIRSELRGALE